MKWLSLFSGIGGFDLALTRKGHKVIGACEIDRYARSVYVRHFPGVQIFEDATKLTGDEFGEIDGICAGFPCQAFSIAGKRLGFEESRGTLFFEIARLARKKRPRLLLLENVKGLLSHDTGKTFANILATLDELGYDAEWQVLNSKYWVPQNRERIFIVGHLRGTSRPKVFPARETGQEPDGRNAEEQVANSLQTPGHACGNYKGMTMIQENNLKRSEGKPNVYHTDAQAGKIYDTDGISPTVSGQRVNSQGWIKEPKLNQLNNPKHSGNHVYGTDGIARALKNNTHTNTGLYAFSSSGRKHGREARVKAGEANTICTGKGGNHQSTSNFVINESNIRRLTPVECERLQGFPENHTKFGKDGEIISDTQRYRMCGNAVTVPVIEFILERLK